jgi:metalloendopeptidase OMA1, mitochondrial
MPFLFALRPSRIRTWATMLSIAIVSALIHSGCQQVPVSGRRQLLIGNESNEIQMGVTAYQEVLAKEPRSTNKRYIEMVNRVGNRIAAVAGRDDFDWEFNVIANDTQNAFCLPGGKVAFYEGILPVCQTEAGLAVVMSHEIAHALARHGGERMSLQKVKTFGGIGVDAIGKWAMEDGYDKHQATVLTAYGYVSEYGALLPYSRKHESEADLIGIELMAKAGYDPTEAPQFWERFAQAKGGAGGPEWLSTHPSDSRRASDLRASLPNARNLYTAAKNQYGSGEMIVVVESTNIQPVSAEETRLR